MFFIEKVTELLGYFAQTTEDLLMDTAFMKEEHHKARDELKKLLASFDQSLQEVQHLFTNMEPQPPTKKVKVENEERPNPATASATIDQQNPISTTNATSDTESVPIDSVPISQNSGWQHFVTNMHPLRSD
jgi:hypothetical protein